MGNFLDDINKVKMECNAKKREVENIIVEHFATQLDMPNFEKKLKADIIKNIKKNSKSVLWVQFWKHHDGCSPTHYGMSFCKDFYGNGGYDNNYYDGIDLWDIRYDVTKRLCDLYEKKLSSLGLKYSRETKTSWLDYPEYRYDIIV